MKGIDIKGITKQTAVVLFVYLFAVFSGAIRKWGVSSTAVGNIFLGVLLVTPYAFFVIDPAGGRKVFSSKMLSLYLILLLAMCFNPLNKTIMHGVLGLIIHFNFWFATFYYIENRDKFQFERLIFIFAIVSLFEFILTSIQYQLPQDNILNKYADEKLVGNTIAVVGQSVRVTGTFSFLAGYASFITFHGFLVIVMIRTLFRPSFTVFLFLFGLMSGFMNGSRGAVYSYLFIIVSYLIAEARNTRVMSLIGRLILPAVVVYAIFLLAGDYDVSKRFGEAYSNFEERRTTLAERGEESGRIQSIYKEVIDFRGRYPFFGVGLGSTYQGAQVLFGISEYVIEYGPLENEWTRIVLEGGFLLLFLKFVMTYTMVMRLQVSIYMKAIISALIVVISPVVFSIYSSIFVYLGVTMLDYFMYKDKIGKPIKFDNAF